jgi:predicted SprT family Zn-dependent metalloprotease
MKKRTSADWQAAVLWRNKMEQPLIPNPTPNPPTLTTYAEWQTAYDFFNKELFGGALPDCIIILDNKGNRIKGYFSLKRYGSLNGKTIDCLAMNPLHFHRRDLIDTLSTLVHEMCHVWEAHFNQGKSKGYHNKKWGEQMEKIGLMPSNTGLPGGVRTGVQMTHYVIAGGPFETACKRLLAEQFNISWADRSILLTMKPGNPISPPGGGQKPSGHLRSKYKYVCHSCGAIVWGKPNLPLICGKCQVAFEMEAGR